MTDVAMNSYSLDEANEELLYECFQISSANAYCRSKGMVRGYGSGMVRVKNKIICGYGSWVWFGVWLVHTKAVDTFALPCSPTYFRKHSYTQHNQQSLNRVAQPRSHQSSPTKSNGKTVPNNSNSFESVHASPFRCCSMTNNTSLNSL